MPSRKTPVCQDDVMVSYIIRFVNRIFHFGDNDMDRKIHATEYGICFWSMETFTGFLKKEKIRSKKLLALFQKDDKLFLKLVENGIWIPLPQVDSVDYCIKIKNLSEEYDNQWEKVLEYGGFNIEIVDGLWISGLGSFFKFDRTLYQGEGHEYIDNFGMKNFDSNKERWHITLNDYKIYHDVHVDIPSGKYLLTVKGYSRKEPKDISTDKEAVNFGYQLELVKVDTFNGYKNPREDEFEFNIGKIIRTRN